MDLRLFFARKCLSPDTNRSAIGRLAGEMIWLPSALLPQRGVSWKAIDQTTIQASLKIDGEPVTLTLFINSEGKLLKISFPRWGEHTDDGSFTYIPFGGEFHAERTVMILSPRLNDFLPMT